MAVPLLPVTALRPHGSSLLFAACGNHIEIYHNNQRLHAVKIFNRQPVHGLLLAPCSEQSPLLLVFGGPLVRAACISSATLPAVALSHLCKADDRILHAAFQPPSLGFTPPDQSHHHYHHAALITAHNKLLQLTISHVDNESTETEWVDGTPSAFVVPPRVILADPPRLSLSTAALSAASNSLLYNARLRWLARSHVLIVAGTAFGDILVWTCVLAPGDLQAPPRCRLHFFFEAHPGSSVFGLDLFHAPLCSSGDSNRLLVASCSDERTVKVWDISSVLAADASDDQLPPRIDQHHRSHAPLQVAATWAHISRIWHVAFTGRSVCRQSQSAIELVSAGEDGTCQLHLLNEGAELSRNGSSKGESIVVSSHAGKNVWSLKLQELPGGLFCAFTGGADGAVVARTLAPADRVLPSVVETSIQSILSSARQPVSESPTSTAGRQPPAFTSLAEPTTGAKDRIRSIMWTCKSSALLMTTGSGLIVGDTGLDSSDWTVLGQVAELKGHSVSCALPESDNDDALLAGAQGDVLYVRTQTHMIQHLFKIGQRITSLLAARIVPHRNTSSAVEQYAFIAPTLGTSHRHVELRILNVDPSGDPVPSALLLGTLLYDDHDIACFTVLQSTADVLSILLGHRGGRLSLYHIPWGSSNNEAQALFAPCTTAQYHTDTITSIHILTQPFPLPDSKAGAPHILTTARDATYAIAAYDAADSSIKPLHRCTTPLGPHLEGAALDKHAATPTLRLYGFRSGSFVVQDALVHRDLAALPTGGANRLWSYAPSPSAGTSSPSEALGSLSWVRATHLHTAHVHSTPTRILKAGTHGREIKAAALRPGLFPIAGVQRTLLATGAEDTDVRLHTLVDSMWRTVAVLRGHSAGVHCVAWTPDGRRLVSAGGRGELRVWRVRQAPLVGVGVLCECAERVGPEDVDVRVMGIDVRLCSRGGEEEDALEACVALSDSGFLQLRYDHRAARWATLWSGKYSDICLTQIFFLHDTDKRRDATANTAVIGATASDGRLALWQADVKSPSTPYKTHKMHQSAPKAQLQLALPSARTLLITASDDNSIALTLLAAMPAEAPPTADTLLLPRAHAASVSALAPLRCTDAGPGGPLAVRFASAGNDQRVRVWEALLDDAAAGIEGVQLRRLCSAYTNVADVGALCVLPPSLDDDAVAVDVLVVGVGLEVLRLPVL